MFRDPSFFRDAPRARSCPQLETYPSIKVWIAGCSTGEEAYSLAIVFREEGIFDRTTFYATDINPEALRTAEAGGLPARSHPDVHRKPPAAGGPRLALRVLHGRVRLGACSIASLRKQMVFSDHSLATDSVFAEVQLVSCRNVLIYFDRALQDRALGLMRDSLCRRGFLGLGAKETLRYSAHADAFRQIAPPEPWFQRC